MTGMLPLTPALFGVSGNDRKANHGPTIIAGGVDGRAAFKATLDLDSMMPEIVQMQHPLGNAKR